MGRILLQSPGPHLGSPEQTRQIMWLVVLSLLPASLAGVYFFGFGALVVLATSVAAAVVTEYLWIKYVRGKEVRADGSAVVTGLLLGLTLPPGISPLYAFIGAVVAIILGKQVYGGLGSNPFNPALVGRTFLLISFPVVMTTWQAPWDATTTATPLSLLATGGPLPSWGQLFWGNVGGSLGETSVLALALGGLYLIYKGYIDWRIPTGVLGSAALFSLALGIPVTTTLFSGGLVLGAFFMATDYVTSPVTPAGRWLFAIGIGLITMVIRQFGGYPEGVSFAILLMNAAVPLLEKLTWPKAMGAVQ
ncbi:MAG: RnfABCDGE type electron transport complex subunit D [Firmicutes bacterium]|nr:RnfABCDGE type electron transport complex subunit D [Bacillota bacterium]